MEEYKEDLRVIRTRKLLSKAMFDLLETTPFEKISVMDICEHAMVHRATFYNHFESKEHLLEYTIDGVKEELYQKSIAKEAFASPKEMYMSIISTVVDFADTNRKKFGLILSINNYEKVFGLLVSTIRRSIKYLLSKNEYHIDYKVPQNILIDFAAGGMTNMGLNWLQSPNPCSKQELLKYFEILLPNDMLIMK